jgi:hypothetical protein
MPALEVPMTRWSFALLLSLTACGGGEESSEPEVVPRTGPQADCDTLMATFCDSSLECLESGLEPDEIPSAEELSHQRTLCVDVAKRTCDAVLVVDEGRYDECFADAETLGTDDCEAVRTAVRDGNDVSMPDSCLAVFTGK